MKTIGVYHTKGGVGKSATTVFLADFLSSLYEKRVVVVDLDRQNNSAAALVGEERLRASVAKRPLPRLLREAERGEPTRDNVLSFITQREPPSRRRRRVHYLEPVSVLAGTPAEWDRFDDWLGSIPKESLRNYLDVLADCLRPIEDDFDICLIDFPAAQYGALAKIGMRASGWWLLPDKPDWFSSGDLHMPVSVVHDAQKNSNHRIRPLGTLLSICPTRSNASYRKARAALVRLSEEGGIPGLFSKEAEVLHRSDALNALDKSASAARTLVERYGSSTSPFFVGLRNLVREVLARLAEPTRAPKLPVLAAFRRKLADYWR